MNIDPPRPSAAQARPPLIDDGTHTGLSARFEEEIARDRATRAAPEIEPDKTEPTDGATSDAGN